MTQTVSISTIKHLNCEYIKQVLFLYYFYSVSFEYIQIQKLIIFSPNKILMFTYTTTDKQLKHLLIISVSITKCKVTYIVRVINDLICYNIQYVTIVTNVLDA